MIVGIATGLIFFLIKQMLDKPSTLDILGDKLFTEPASPLVLTHRRPDAVSVRSCWWVPGRRDLQGGGMWPVPGDVGFELRPSMTPNGRPACHQNRSSGGMKIVKTLMKKLQR